MARRARLGRELLVWLPLRPVNASEASVEGESNLSVPVRMPVFVVLLGLLLGLAEEDKQLRENLERSRVATGLLDLLAVLGNL